LSAKALDRVRPGGAGDPGSLGTEARS